MTDIEIVKILLEAQITDIHNMINEDGDTYPPSWINGYNAGKQAALVLIFKILDNRRVAISDICSPMDGRNMEESLPTNEAPTQPDPTAVGYRRKYTRPYDEDQF